MLAELKAAVADHQRRLVRCTERHLEQGRTRLTSAARGLPRPADIIGMAGQRFDNVAGKLGAALERNAAAHERDLVRCASRLTPTLLDRPRRLQGQRLAEIAARVEPALRRHLARTAERLAGLDKLRTSFNPDGPLTRGFARVHHADGSLARSAAALASGEAVRMVFADGERGAVVDGAPAASPALSPPRRGKGSAPGPGQGDLF